MLRAYPDLVQNTFAKTYPFMLHIEVEAFYQDERADERLMAFLESAGDIIEVSDLVRYVITCVSVCRMVLWRLIRSNLTCFGP